jgi:hypothetical protein
MGPSSEEEVGSVSFAFERSPDLSRQVLNALEDEAAQPLNEVQRHAPEGCDYFSELEASLGEWSFGYGVAWALARAGDPLLSSSAAARIAETAVNDAWRLFSTDQRWTSLLAEDRAQRGPVDGDADLAGESADLGQFMQKIGRARPTRELRGTGTDG